MARSVARAAASLAALAFVALASAATSADETMTISSPKFDNNGQIPQLYTCKGSNLSPPLQWSGVPSKTKSLALVVEDPDANEPPQHGFVHWIVYDIPPSSKGLKEGAKSEADFPKGAREGLNDAMRPQWSAPCPPKGTHHYVFKLYALDDTISRAGANKVVLEDEMRGHVLAKAELVGLAHK